MHSPAVIHLLDEVADVEVVPYSDVQIELPKTSDDAEITRLLKLTPEQQRAKDR